MQLGDMSGGDAVDNVVAGQETQQPPEQTETNQPEDSDGEAKKRTGYQRKLEKKDAEIERLRRELEASSKPQAADTPEAEPKEDDFETWTDYLKAMAKYESRQALKEDSKTKREAESQKKVQEQREKLVKDYQSKASDYRKTATDFDEAINDYDGPWNGAIQQALLESDLGPQVAYYLAKNVEEADKMEGMTLLQLHKFIGRIESRLESETPSVAKTTKAQPPINPVRKGASVSTKDPGDMSLSEFEAWEKGRRKQLN